MNKYSSERKRLQAQGELPDWYTSQGYQMFKEKYQWASSPKEQYKAIAKTLAQWMKFTKWEDVAEDAFFKLLWKGWLSPSTPVLANVGTNRGLPIACSGGYIPDSIDGFYTARREVAILTKQGFGTSGYFGDVRYRGSAISSGGVASGVLPVFKGFVRDMQEVAQGCNRRGSFAGYLPIDHGDFDELCDLLHNSPDDLNVGWIFADKDIQLLESADVEMTRRYQKALKTKMITGKGYFFFVDKANRHKPECYKELDLDIKASNLCTEIMLHSSEDLTFTCTLASMNLAKYDEWKDTDAVFWAIAFLDCVVEEFLWRAKDIPGLEKAVKFTELGRPIGLGVMGLHTYFQQRGMPFESLEAQFTNATIFRNISNAADSASRDLAIEIGQPEWCRGYNQRRNTHVMAVAPTKSTALLMGGVSEGINPDVAMVFTQATSAGEVFRVNPTLLKLMKEKGVYNEETLTRISNNYGSVQNEDWLTADEKKVFKTAFEINQSIIVRLASQRQKYIDQGQSLNLFFSADASAEYISKVTKQAFLDEDILSLYYYYSSKQPMNQTNCEGCAG